MLYYIYFTGKVENCAFYKLPGQCRYTMPNVGGQSRKINAWALNNDVRDLTGNVEYEVIFDF